MTEERIGRAVAVDFPLTAEFIEDLLRLAKRCGPEWRRLKSRLLWAHPVRFVVCPLPKWITVSRGPWARPTKGDYSPFARGITG